MAGPKTKLDRPGRTNPEYLRAAALLKAKQLPCHICGLPINYGVSGRHPDGFSADHVITRASVKHLDHATQIKILSDPSNLLPAHMRCNSKRQSKPLNAPSNINDHSSNW